MLPKQHRIVRTKDVQSALRSKDKAYTKHARIIVRNTDTQRFRVLVIVGKKIYKKANKRNRIRRKIQAVMEQALLEGDLAHNLDCVIHVTSKEILTSNSEDIKKELLPKVQSLSRL